MKNLFIISLALSSMTLFSQVQKKVVAEHFTNTKCSVCASRNPGFYTNLNNQQGVFHLSIHPSSPYAACVLSQHNVAENDGRTNYYGVYGATPVLIIQGTQVPNSSNFSSPSIFTPYLSQTSPASIKIYQYKYGNDSIRSRIVIKTEATHTLPNLSLFVALAEDTLNYTGSNGEPVHYNVFRKSLTGTTGISVVLPPTVGDSIVYTKSSPANVAWNFSRIFTLAILQETTGKSVVQSEVISAKTNNVVTGIQPSLANTSNVSVFINDKNIYINQTKFSEGLTLNLYDISGRNLLTNIIETSSYNLSVSNLSAGIYIYAIKSKDGVVKTGKVLID